MNFKINNTTSAKKADKSKKTAKASAAEGSSFASALQNASQSESVDGTSSVSSVASVESFVYDQSSQVPLEAKSRGYYILDLLEELEKDILSGNETKVISKLEEALNTQAIDKDSLPPTVQELLDQIESRALIELEKVKAK